MASQRPARDATLPVAFNSPAADAMPAAQDDRQSDAGRQEDRREGGASFIEIRLTRVAQLFASLDPAPFHEKDLDPAAEAYIVDWVAEFPPEAKLKLLIHLPAEGPASEEARGVPAAVANYFHAREAAAWHELRQ